MVKHSRKMRGGVVSLPDVDKAVETVNELSSQLKALQMSASDNAYGMESSSSSDSSPMESSSSSDSSPMESSSLDMSDYNSEPSAMESSADMSFKTDKDYKYSNPETSVKLSYPRIITLLQNLISKNPTSNRKEVLDQLEAATTREQVQQIINDSKLRLASNYVMGGKTKKRGSKRKGGKRTMRR
jgi:hypothetical protein